MIRVRDGFRTAVLRKLLAILAMLVPALAATAQEAAVVQGESAGGPDLAWRPIVSDVPLVDLSGRWIFVALESDPMVEAWEDVPVRYTIQHLSDRILLDFRPEGGRSNVQAYRWDGQVAAFERGAEEVRERAVWTEGGRVLEIDGRRWRPGESDGVVSYRFVYRLDGPDRLLFEQHAASGSTRWIFVRE